jgi:peptide/nickel transport system permease protein
MSRLRYFLVRTVQTVFMLWLALTFLFFFFRLLPGSYTDIMVFQGASEEAIAAFEKQWGLNDPLYIQYWNYLTNMVTLDAGTSLRFRTDVWEFVRPKMVNSFILIAPAITLAYIVGSGIGAVIGNARGSKIEKYGLLPILFFGSVPSFFLAILLVIVFSFWLGWFPTSGMVSSGTAARLSDAPWWRVYFTTDFATHYVLPFAAIFIRYLYLPVLIMRTSVVEVLGQDFTFYHRMSGLFENTILAQIAKHASLPVITMYPVSMTRAIGGLVLVEVVFNWPGIGFALVQSVFSRDFPVTQFVFFLVAAFVIIANYLIDFVYGVIDPRISVE